MKAADTSKFPRIVRENCFCVLDLEATGLSPRDEIIQVAAIQIDRGCIGLRAASYVRPLTAKIGDGAYAKHGIDYTTLQHAPTFEEIAGDLEVLIGNRCLLGFGIERFDYPMLARHYARYGQPFYRRTLDVLLWERKLFTEKGAKHNLNVVAERYGIVQRAHHDALDDCRTTWNVFLRLAAQHEALGELELHEAAVDHEPEPLPEGVSL